MTGEAFFTLHDDLPREGPGSRADLDWACALAGVARDARILDAGCGPGADVEGLLAHAAQGRVVAVDPHAPYIAAVRARFGDDPRVDARVQDMGEADGPFDFIWCAGALYFLGLEPGLAALGAKLAPGGAIAFSHLVYTVPDPDPALAAALEAELPDIGGVPELQARILAAGFAIDGLRVLGDAAWEAYYGPMRARIARLRPGSDAALREVMDEAEAEIALRERFGGQFGYALSVVRPA